jgi:beta-glucosidase
VVSPLDGIREALEGRAEVTHRAGVRLGVRVGVAPLTLVSDGGTPGVRVRLLAEDGAELLSEHRGTGQLTWLGQWGGGVASGSVATIEVTATLTALESGPHTVGCSGIGTFRLSSGTRTLFDGSISPDPGLAAHEAMLSIPQWSTTVELRAGESTDLTLRYEVPGGFDAAKLELNVEGPLEGPSGEAVQAQPCSSPGRRPLGERSTGEAVELARAADAVVLVVGTTEEVESEGFDRTTLALPGDQDALVRAVLAVNPRTVVVVNSGAPVLLPWVEDAAAVLLAWFPGQEFGRALADVLFGAVEPGGRLPVTWPASEAGLLPTRPVDGVLTYGESIRIGYRRDDGPAVAFPFGHGLGYTGWDFESLDAGPDGVRVTVRNAGRRAGREVVQLYAGRPDSAVDRPRWWLVGFAVVSAGPGERRTVSIPLNGRAVAHWDVDSAAWAVEPGEFTLAAGRSVADLPLVSSWSPAPDGR